MPNDLPDWTHNASVPGLTITLPTASGSSATTVTLPNRAAALLLDVLTTNFSTLIVQGVTSGEQYLSLSPAPVGSKAVMITDSRDAQVIVNVFHTIGVAPDTVDVSFMPAATIAMLAAGSVVDVTDRAARLLGVVQEGASPPLWQAPRAYASNELTIVSSVVLVTGVANQTVRLFGWSIEIDNAASASIGWLEDTTSPVGTVAARLAAFSSTGTSGGSGYEAGKPVTVGQGIRLNVPLLGAAGVVRATVGFSQG